LPGIESQPQTALRSILKKSSSIENTQPPGETSESTSKVTITTTFKTLPPLKLANQRLSRSSIANESVIIEQPLLPLPSINPEAATAQVAFEGLDPHNPQPLPIEPPQPEEGDEDTFVELPEIFRQHQRRKQSLAKVKNVRIEEKEQLSSTFNRFYHHTPRYVESKPMFEEWRRKKRSTEKNIHRGIQASQKKDKRYDNLLDGLCGMKVLDRDKPRLYLY
jgi:hypothetical protein